MGSKRKSSDENGDGEESPTRAGGSKRRAERGETLHEFMKRLEPGDRQVVQNIIQKYDINVPQLSSRLGVRGMAKEVQEGISNPFRVKDRHVKRYQKDRLLSMNDEVCYLKGIFKNGPVHKKLIECKINTVRDFLYYCSKKGPETLRAMIGMTEGRWATTYGHASKSWELSDIPFHDCLVNPPALDQNFYELTGSSSSQLSNVLVQPNGSGMSTSAQGLAAPISFEPGKTTFIISAGICSDTNQLDIPCEELLEENERSYVPNNFDICSPLLRDKLLMLLFVARLKMAAPRPRKSKYSETSSPRCNWFKLLFIANLKVTVLRFRKRKHSETSSPWENDGYFNYLCESPGSLDFMSFYGGRGML